MLVYVLNCFIYCRQCWKVHEKPVQAFSWRLMRRFSTRAISSWRLLNFLSFSVHDFAVIPIKSSRHTHTFSHTQTRASVTVSPVKFVCTNTNLLTYLLYCLQAIRLLVEKSKLLQKEIVAQGRVCDLLLLCSWHYKFSFYTRYYRDMYTFFRSLIRRLITGTTYLSSLCSLC